MDDRQSDPGQSESSAVTIAPHPEELSASIDLQFGASVRLRAHARATPAGLITATVLVMTIAVPLVWLSLRRSGARQRA